MQKIQSAITFWGMIALATGGYLKQSKCQVALTLFDFPNGKATVQKARNFPSMSSLSHRREIALFQFRPLVLTPEPNHLVSYLTW